MAAGEGRQVGASDRRGPVFDLPPSPEVGNGWGRGLVRIVDPAGFAVAWFDPGSARCLEFMVRSLEQDRTAWRSVFAVPGAQEMNARNAGCGVLAGAGDSGSWGMRAEEDADWPGAEWRVLQRDPTSVILQATLPDEDGAVAGKVLARLVAQLDDAMLSLFLTMHNDGEAACPAAFGFLMRFPPNVMNGFRQLEVHEGGDRICLRSTVERGATHDCVSQVVVTCDEGVRYLRPQADPVEGSQAFAMFAAPPGEPALIRSGACEQLAVSIAVLPQGEDILQ